MPSDYPYLEMVEEPMEFIRYRYETENGNGTHGALIGRTSAETSPTVQLCNFKGSAIVICWLSQLPCDTKPHPAPHSHNLVVRLNGEHRRDPHQVTVSQAQGYVATFSGMSLICTIRGRIREQLLAKFEKLSQFGNAAPIDEAVLDNYATNMNLHQVYLCFEAFERRGPSWIRICDTIYSQPINNEKSVDYGRMQIVRVSSVAGNPAGGEEVFIFVDNVNKSKCQRTK